MPLCASFSQPCSNWHPVPPTCGLQLLFARIPHVLSVSVASCHRAASSCKLLQIVNGLLFFSAFLLYNVTRKISRISPYCFFLHPPLLGTYLFVRRLELQVKTIDRMFMITLPDTYVWTRKTPLNFGTHPDVHPDPRIFNRVFTNHRGGQTILRVCLIVKILRYQLPWPMVATER